MCWCRRLGQHCRVPINIVRLTILCVVDAHCGNSSFIGTTGTILSPGYPLSYPPNLDCVYTIDVDRTKTISFDFLQFNLEGTSKFPKKDVCLNDWLKVSKQCHCNKANFHNASKNEVNLCVHSVHMLSWNYKNLVIANRIITKFATNR